MYDNEQDKFLTQLVSVLNEANIKYVNPFPELKKSKHINPRPFVTENHPDERMHEIYTKTLLSAFDENKLKLN